MAKKSQRRVVNHERGHSGCMSGLIGIFDFRHTRSTRKLLSDKRHGSSRHPAADTAMLRSGLKLSRNSGKKHRGKDTNVDNFSDGDEREELMVGSNKTSVKKLLEEDMSNEQQTEKQVPNAAKEQLQSGPNYEGNAEKNHKQTKETCKDACDNTGVSVSMGSQEYYQTNSAKRLSLLDITSLMEEFCSQIQQHQEIWRHNESGGNSCSALVCTDLGKHEKLGELDMREIEKHSVLQEKLSEAAVTFLNQKLIDTKQFKEDGAIHQSKQFIDALEILNSNKELLLKFLPDSNSSGVKYIREVQDIRSPLENAKQEKLLGAKSQKGIGSSERGKELACRKEVQKHNIHNFFRKKDKSQKRNSWNLGFGRAINDWEVEGIALLLAKLEEVHPTPNIADSRVWWPGKEGKFSPKSFYFSLISWRPPNPAMSPIHQFPSARIWGSGVPARVAFFVWCASLGRILTVDNLRKRNFHGATPDKCLLCNLIPESVHHVLLHCDFSWQVWSCFFGECDLPWVCPGRVIDLFSGWSVGPFSVRGRRIWSLLPFAVMWGIWLERNRRHFEGKAGDLQQVVLSIKGLLCFWARAFPESRGVFFEDLVARWAVMMK